MWPTRYPARRLERAQLFSGAQPFASEALSSYDFLLCSNGRPRKKKRAWQRSVLSAGLAALLGGTGIWLTEALIAPQASQAYTSRLDLFLTKESGETYDTLLRRGEMAARAGAQRSFDQDLLITNVSVTVVVEGDGTSVPILALRVDRDQWRARPETYYWATYYRTAEALLNSPSGSLGL
jgi:hypothetical protein